MDYKITYGQRLNPLNDLTGKKNYRIFILIDENGNITERILLNTPNDMTRETIICGHFLQHYFNCFAMNSAVTDLISRDDPWDFHIKVDDTEDLIIEITAMADNPQLFEKFKNEERLLSITKERNMTIRELNRLEFAFPDVEIKSLIEKYIFEGKLRDDVVANPYFGKDSFVFLSSQSPYVPDFHENLQVTINKKLNKNHSNKGEVILIVDNRTVLPDLKTVNEKLSEIKTFIDDLPFKEVWLYTGYYSNDDGINSEYTLIPLKVSYEKIEVLRSFIG